MSSNRSQPSGSQPGTSPNGALWGKQTELSRRFFAIGRQCMPIEIVHALAEVNRAAAEVNGCRVPMDAYTSGRPSSRSHGKSTPASRPGALSHAISSS